MLLHADQAVDRGSASPAAASRAEGTLRTHVSHLCKRLSPAGTADTLVTERPSYRLRLAPEQFDAYRFERTAGLEQEALSLGDTHRAAALLREALGSGADRCWRISAIRSSTAAETARGCRSRR